MLENDSSLKNTPAVFIIGAGGIVNDAHLPAYKIAGFNVAGIYDVNIEKAKAVAEKFSIPAAYENMEQMLGKVTPGVVFDLAVPAHALVALLQKLPDHAVVLMQKPMGENYEQAKQILQITRDKKMM